MGVLVRVAEDSVVHIGSDSRPAASIPAETPPFRSRNTLGPLRACENNARERLGGTRTPWRQLGLGPGPEPGPWPQVVSKAKSNPTSHFGEVLLEYVRRAGISVQVQV